MQDLVSKSIATLKTMKPVPPEDLEKLHTGSLLTRLQGLRSLHASFETSDWSPEARDAVEAAGLVAFKDTEIWQTAFQNLKQRLSRREHFPRAG
ncbi:hypothetical protein CHH27_21465 [Labrenzia sp. VG12]|nr:hypothetical protein CHH27_21465 [Labrenzia sp. VG12]